MKNILMILGLCAAVFGQRIPASSPIAVSLIESIDSSKATEGQTYRASVAEAVVVNGREIVPRGADAVVTLVNLDKSGKFKGSTQLAVRLTSLSVNGRSVNVETGEVTRVSGGQGKNTALKTGIGAGIGAAIGAIAGGGRGAAIGAGSGAAAGAGSQIFTKGQKVQIPSETVLRFLTTRQVRLGGNSK
ncbi:MAG: hypothetical protein NTW74_23150 [Acidobacteria bacterium]|nr:hypothetical protein [Acidobacteriota bacterium]